MSFESRLVEANSRFAVDLLKKLSNDNKTGNIFCSPFSISTALSMVLLGAEGNTKKQISEVLHFSDLGAALPGGGQQQSQDPSGGDVMIQEGPQNDFYQTFALLLEQLNKPDSEDLITANRAYGEKTLTFNESFLVDINSFFKAQLETVDFKEAAEAARTVINEWVKNQTKEKIENLLSEGSVNSLTKLVLVNAIYFKGKWLSKFKEDETKDVDFTITTTERRPVKMMQQRSHFSFAHRQEEGIKVLEMPYKENDLNMTIILPDDKEDDTALEKLLNGLTFEKLTTWTSEGEMHKLELAVSLPKFKMEQSYDLTSVLTAMGMVDAFDPSLCKLTGMSAAPDLVVSRNVHKAVVEVNEEGTEAAAATGAIIGTTSVEPVQTFEADHPFLIFVKHKPTKSILFAGRYSSPDE